MSNSIPEYYRHLAAQQKQPAPPPPRPEASPNYRGNLFSLSVPPEWQDKTLYILAGPVSDNIQHNITVSIDQEPKIESLPDYAEWQIRALEEALQGCRLLRKEEVKLTNGMPGFRAVFSWHPTAQLCLYQEQLYVLHEKNGFKLTATFTEKTHRTLGQEITRIMLSFAPDSTA